ncbi:MAG: rod shape-determining protein MreC, partial [Sphingomicrobium sp.]
MATARPGWSRRAQYGLFFSFLAVIAGIIVGLIMLALSLVAPKTFQTVRGAALDVTGPVASALHEVTATASGLVTGAGDYWDAASQNAELKRERHAMLQRMIEAKAIFQENRQLKTTLQLRERNERTI